MAQENRKRKAETSPGGNAAKQSKVDSSAIEDTVVISDEEIGKASDEESEKQPTEVTKRFYLAFTNIMDQRRRDRIPKPGDLNELDALIKQKADVNYIDPLDDQHQNFSLLSLAAEADQLDIVRCLIKAKAEVNPGPFDFCIEEPSNFFAKPSALGFAAYNGNLKMATILLDAGADVDAGLEADTEYEYPDVRGCDSPLANAFEARNYCMINLLVSRKASPYIPDDSIINKILTKKDNSIMQILVKNKTNFKLTKKFPLPILYYVVEHNLLAALPTFFEHQLVDVTDGGILSHALKKLEDNDTCDKILKTLLFHKVHPTDTRKDAKEQPLHIAASLGQPKTVQLLLEHNAALFKRNSKGETAAQVARNHGHESLAVSLELLMSNGPTAQAMALIAGQHSRVGRESIFPKLARGTLWERRILALPLQLALGESLPLKIPGKR